MTTKTIAANIPARTLKLTTGTRKVAAYSVAFEQDAEGRWTSIEGAVSFAATEADVIAACRKASNWDAIRREHFPMHGFHS